LSLNKKNARKDTRRQMDKYKEAYMKNFSSGITIMLLVITQNSYFDENQYLRDEYPCIVLSLREIKEVELDLESIIRENCKICKIYLRALKFVKNINNYDNRLHLLQNHQR
jgi:hypothetical protein